MGKYGVQGRTLLATAYREAEQCRRVDSAHNRPPSWFAMDEVLRRPNMGLRKLTEQSASGCMSGWAGASVREAAQPPGGGNRWVNCRDRYCRKGRSGTSSISCTLCITGPA